MATLSLKLGEGLGILLPQLDLNPEVLVHLIPAICAGGYSNSISLLTLTPLLTTPDSAQKRTCHKNSCHYMLAHIFRSHTLNTVIKYRKKFCTVIIIVVSLLAFSSLASRLSGVPKSHPASLRGGVDLPANSTWNLGRWPRQVEARFYGSDVMTN